AQTESHSQLLRHFTIGASRLSGNARSATRAYREYPQALPEGYVPSDAPYEGETLARVRGVDAVALAAYGDIIAAKPASVVMRCRCATERPKQRDVQGVAPPRSSLADPFRHPRCEQRRAQRLLGGATVGQIGHDREGSQRLQDPECHGPTC